MSTSRETARRLPLSLIALAIAVPVFGGCVWLGGELMRPLPPARNPDAWAPAPLTDTSVDSIPQRQP
jgi:hypothetical protein